ncbi:MAG: hypothetical protein RL594_20 [Bacteroidota bacterium]|jgi:hypothetical protein
MPLTEADIEQIALDWFAECGYACVHGPVIAPEMPASECVTCERIVLRTVRITGMCEIVGRRSLDNIIHHRRSIA